MDDFERKPDRVEWDMRGVLFCALLTSNTDNTSSFHALIDVAVKVQKFGGWEEFIELGYERLVDELKPCVAVCGTVCMACAVSLHMFHFASV